MLGHTNLWYIAARQNATWYAAVQGYKGARWGKETGPQFDREIDSNLRTTCGGGLNLICQCKSPRLALCLRKRSSVAAQKTTLALFAEQKWRH